MKILWILHALLPTILGIEASSRVFTGIPTLRWAPPVRRGLPMADVQTSSVDMPLDNFDPSNNRTFKMRYIVNNQFGQSPNSPLLIMVGGEWSIDPSFVLYGSMYEIAKQNGAQMMYTEHRYYGESQPFDVLTTANLKYLSVEQALADLARFIEPIRNENPKRKIVLFGGSYAANMVVWFSQRYPHLVDGAVASSGPVLAEKDFRGYLQVVHDTMLEEGGSACVDVLTEAIQDLRSEMSSEDGRERIADAYQLCPPIDPKEQFDVEFFYALIAYQFAGLVQGASPGSVARECRLLTSDELGATPFEKLARYTVSLPPGYCQEVKYRNMVEACKDTDKGNEGRLWYYQTCNEFGYYVTSPSSGTAFDGLIPVEFHEEVCREAFGDEFTSDFIDRAVNKTNIDHGGLTPNVSNLLSVYGLQDPWHALGIQEDLGPTSPTYLVPKASHCFDLYGTSGSDTEEMAELKQRVSRIMAEWLTH